MDSFGGGLAAHGEVCGIVIGGLAVIGLRFGRSKTGTKSDMKMWKYGRIFMKRFREEITDNKILCREIVNVDWMDTDQARNYRGSDKFQCCLMLTGRAAKLIGEILKKAQEETSDNH